MLTYSLQVNLCWLMFYGLYYALLSRETFFKLNRIYLIISLLCGLIVPFVTTYLSQMEDVSTMPFIQAAQPITQSIALFQDNIEINMVKTEETWNLYLILRGIYFIGVLCFLTRFGIGLFKIFKLYRTGFKEKNKDFTLVQVVDLKTPFSFLHWIFIDKKAYQTVEYEQIIEHEKAHVQQKHTFDIIGLEILRGLFWLSPLVHLYARSMRNVHEYLADAAVLQNTEKKQYGRLLINQTVVKSNLILANHFNFSQLKKRIIMMTRNRSERKALVKYSLAAPLFLLSILAFTVPNSPWVKNTEGVSLTLENTFQKLNNKLLKSNAHPEVKVKGAIEGWVLPKNLNRITALQIDEGYEILGFKMIVQEGDGNPAQENFINKGSIFEKTLIDRIKKSKPNDYFHFVDILIQDLVRNEKYIYGDCYLHIVNKIPVDFINRVAKQKTDVMLHDSLVTTTRVVKHLDDLKNDTMKVTREISQNSKNLMAFIKANTKVPRYIAENRLNGCVFVHFDLSNEGVISKIEMNDVFTNEKKEFVEHDFKECKVEALRILNIIPKELLLNKLKQSIESGYQGKQFIPVNFPTKTYK